MTAVRLMRPDVRYDEVEADIREILESGMLTGGRHVTSFEQEIAAWCGVEHGVATTSATTALHLALAVLGIGPGDEVLVADFTFPATANVVVQTGATPVLVDSGPDDFAVDPTALAAALTEHTAAIMPVDPFGQPADHEAIAKIAADAGVPVVTDAACSLGAVHHGRAAGSHGLMGCFSFHPRKMVTCGEGGMVTTDDPGLAERLRLLRSHGMRRDGVAMRFEEPGFNYRMSEIQAVLGRSQLRRLPAILTDRRRTAAAYDDRLRQMHGVTITTPPDGVEWSYQSYVVVLDDEIDRDAVITGLRGAEIEATIGTYACHTHPAFEGWASRPGAMPNSVRYQAQALTLPLLPAMSDGTVERVVAELERALRNRPPQQDDDMTADVPEWHGLPANGFNPHSWIVGEPDIGDGCWIGAFTLIDGSGGLRIGQGCDISSGAQIYTHSTVRRVISERELDIERAPTRIGDCVHVGAGAIVLMGSDIGDHCVIGAGAVVSQHTVAPPWSLLVGTPAKIIDNGARRYQAETVTSG